MFTKVLKVSRALAIATLKVNSIRFTNIVENAAGLTFTFAIDITDSEDPEDLMAIANDWANKLHTAMNSVVMSGSAAKIGLETSLSLHGIVAMYKMVWSTEELDVHDLIEDWGSYLHDVEGNLEMDSRAWAKYQKNPVPTYKDLLMDFGKFPTENYEEIVRIVDVAAKHYNGEL